MSDRIAVMSEGRVEQVGAPHDIYARPQSLFVAGFIGSANLLPGVITSSDGSGTHVRLNGGATVAISASCLQEGMNCAVGTQVTVMLRPEQIMLGASHESALVFHVTDCVFQGASMRVVGRLADDTEVATVVPVTPSVAVPIPGDRLAMSWHAQSPYLLAGWPETAGSTSTNIDSVEAAL
jgi:ABC-type Fe3+/spermidine/putrescine transport system ATPase subunit